MFWWGTRALNIGAAEGQPAVAVGTLDAAGVRFGAGTGLLTFNHTGAGAISHVAGTTVLAGDSSGFTGTTVSGGLLGGAGTVGTAGSTVTIASGGVHAPGNPIGVQTIAGDYINHGTLRIEATPNEADRIVVAELVGISGARFDVMLSPANAARGNLFNGPFTILDKQGAGAIVGTFDPVTKNLLFLDVLLDYAGGDGNEVTLGLQRNSHAFVGVGFYPQPDRHRRGHRRGRRYLCHCVILVQTTNLTLGYGLHSMLQRTI